MTPEEARNHIGDLIQESMMAHRGITADRAHEYLAGYIAATIQYLRDNGSLELVVK